MINATNRHGPDRRHRMSSTWISGTTQYALRAVLYVAEHGATEPVRVDAIARALNVPRNYLSKTLHALARAGVLRSGRGPRGGFQLAQPPSALRIADVAAPFGDLAVRECLLGRPACGWKNPCSAHSRWEEASRALQSFFRETSVADLLGEIESRPATAPAHDLPRPRVTRAPARKAAAPGRSRRRSV